MSLLLWLAACAHHIDTPPVRELAPAGPTPTRSVCWVEYATGTLPRGLVVARHAVKQDVASTQSGLLLRDDRGTWLVDGGALAGLPEAMREVPGFTGFAMRQAARGWAIVATPESALAALGQRPGDLAGAIPTHGHFDHLGGLVDLPEVPLWMPQGEIDLAARALTGEDYAVLPADARRIGARARPIEWRGAPLYSWDTTWDVYGDGSFVVVSTPGHTPGSVSVFVRLPDGRPILLVGDTVWVREGYQLREPKGWIANAFDSDREGTDDQIGRLWSLHRGQPELTIVPAHDRRVWEQVFGAPGCLAAPPG